MRINNGTNDPVEWEQNGGGGPNEGLAAAQSQSGQLTGLQGTPSIAPVGTAPWVVIFTNLDEPGQQAESDQFSNPEAIVTLNADWKVTVTR